LAGLHRQPPRAAVALVEQADHRDAVLHRRRRRERAAVGRRLADDRAVAGLDDILERIAVGRLAGAAGEQQRRREHRNPARPDHASGVQAS
jgi:hypothetical protein